MKGIEKINKHALLVLVLCFSSVGVSYGQNLKATVKEYIRVMTEKEVTRDAYVEELKPLIDPSANVDSLCEDYYEHWKYNHDHDSYSISSSIENIENTSETTATIIIDDVWHLPSEDIYHYSTKTTWVKKDGKWYRSGIPSEIIKHSKSEVKKWEE